MLLKNSKYDSRANRLAHILGGMGKTNIWNNNSLKSVRAPKFNVATGFYEISFFSKREPEKLQVSNDPKEFSSSCKPVKHRCQQELAENWQELCKTVKYGKTNLKVFSTHNSFVFFFKTENVVRWRRCTCHWQTQIRDSYELNFQRWQFKKPVTLFSCTSEWQWKRKVQTKNSLSFGETNLNVFFQKTKQ